MLRRGASRGWGDVTSPLGAPADAAASIACRFHVLLRISANILTVNQRPSTGAVLCRCLVRSRIAGRTWPRPNRAPRCVAAVATCGKPCRERLVGRALYPVRRGFQQVFDDSSTAPSGTTPYRPETRLTVQLVPPIQGFRRPAPYSEPSRRASALPIRTSAGARMKG